MEKKNVVDVLCMCERTHTVATMPEMCQRTYLSA